MRCTSRKITYTTDGLENLLDLPTWMTSLYLPDLTKKRSLWNSRRTALASSVFTFMVTVLFLSLYFRISSASFQCNATSVKQVVVLFMQAVFLIERCKLKVIAFTSDVLPANRLFFSIIETTSISATKAKHKAPSVACA